MNPAMTPIISALHIALWLPIVAFAQKNHDKEKRPAAKEVIEKFVDALGGEMMLKSMKTFQIKGKVRGGTRESSFDFCYSDGKYSAKIFYGDELWTEAGNDGEYSWQRRGERGQKMKQPLIYDLSIELFGPAALAILLAENIDRLEVVGKEDIDEKPAWKLRSESPEGMEIYRFFDVESGLLVKSELTNGEQSTENFFEYQETDIANVKIIGKCRSVASTPSGGKVERVLLVVESFETEPTIEESRFALPEGLPDNDK